MATEAADLPQAVHERIEAQDSKYVNETTNIATLIFKSEEKILKNGSGEVENFLNLPSTAEGANKGSPDAYEVMEKPDQTKKDASDIQSLQEEKSENRPVATKETSSEEIQHKAVELSTSLDKVEDTTLVQVKSAVDSADATSELIVKSEASHGVREEQIKDKEDAVNDDCLTISKCDDIETRKMDKEHDATVTLEATYDETIKTSPEVNDDSKITIKANDIETQMVDKEYDTTILSEDRMIKTRQEVDDDQEKTSNPDEGEKDIADIPSQEEDCNQVCMNHSTEIIGAISEATDNERNEIDTEVNNDCQIISKPDIETRMLEKEHDTTIESEATADETIKMTELEDAHASEDVDNIILSDANRIQHVSVVESILEEKVAQGRKDIAETPSQEERGSNQVHDRCTDDTTQIISTNSEAKDNVTVLTAGFPCEEKNERNEPDTEMEAEDSKLVNEIASIADDTPKEPHKTLKCKSEVENLKDAKEGSGEGENFLNLPKVSAEANNGSPDALEVMELPDQTKREVCDIQSVQEEKIENRPVEIVATQETSSEELQQNVVQVSTSLDKDKVDDTPLVQVEYADATAELIVEDSAEKLGKSLDVSEALHGVREDQRKDEENQVNDDCPKPSVIETRKMDKEHDTTIALDDETIKICQKVNDDSKITIKPDEMMDKEYDTTILSDRMIKTCQEVNDDQEKTSNPNENERQTVYREAILSEATTNETVVKVCQETTELDVTHPLEEEKDSNGPSIDDKSSDLCTRDPATSIDDSKAPLEVAEEKNKEQESQFNNDQKVNNSLEDIATEMEHDTSIQPETIELEAENVEKLLLLYENQHASVAASILDKEREMDIADIPSQEENCNQVCMNNNSTEIIGSISEAMDNFAVLRAREEENQRKELDTEVNDDCQMISKPDDIEKQMLEKEYGTTILNDDKIKICKEVDETTSKPDDMMDKEDNTTILSEAPPNIFHRADDDQKINSKADNIDTQLMDREQNTTIQPEATANETVEICQETTHDKVTRSNESIKQKKVLNEGKEDYGPSTDAHVNKSSNLDQDNYEASCADQSKETESQDNDDKKVINQPGDIQTRMMETEHDTAIQSEDTADETTKTIELEAAHTSEDVDNIFQSDVNRIQHVSVESILGEKVAEERKDTAEIPSQEEGRNNQVHDGCIDNSEAKNNFTVLTAGEKDTGFLCEDENERNKPDTEVIDDCHMTSKPDDMIMDKENNTTIVSDAPSDETIKIFQDVNDQKTSSKTDEIETQLTDTEQNTTIQSEATANETIEIFQETTQNEGTNCNEDMEKIIPLNENMNQHVSLASFLEEKVAEGNIADNPSEEEKSCNQVHDGAEIININSEAKDNFTVGENETGVPYETKEPDTEMDAFHKELFEQRQQSGDIEKQIKMETDDFKDNSAEALQENSAKERSQASKECTSLEAQQGTIEVSNVVIPSSADEKNVITSEEEFSISEQEVKSEEKTGTGAIHFSEDSKFKILERDEKPSTTCTTESSIQSKEEEILSKDSAKDLPSVESREDIIDTTKLMFTVDPNIKQIELQDKVQLDKNDLLGVATIESDKKEAESIDIQSGDVSPNTLQVNLGESYNPSNEEQKLLPVFVNDTEDDNLENAGVITDSSSAVTTSENTEREKAVVGQADVAKNSDDFSTEKPDIEKPQTEDVNRTEDMDIKSINDVTEMNQESSHELTKEPSFTLEPMIDKSNHETTTAAVDDGIKATEERNEFIGGTLISQRSLDTDDVGREHRAGDKQLIDSVKEAEKANKRDKVIEQDFESSLRETSCEKKIQLENDDPTNEAPNFIQIIMGSNVSEQVQKENENADSKGKIDRKFEEEDRPKDAQMIVANDAAVHEEKGLDPNSIGISLSSDTKEKITLDLIEDLNGEQNESSLITKLPEQERLENMTNLASVATEKNSDDRTNTEDVDVLDEAITISSKENLEHVDPEKSTSLQVPSMQQEHEVTEEPHNASEATIAEELSIKKALEDEKLANITSLPTEENSDNQIVLQPSSFCDKTDDEDVQVLDDSKFLSTENLVQVHPQEPCGEEVEPMQQDPTIILEKLATQGELEEAKSEQEEIIVGETTESSKESTSVEIASRVYSMETSHAKYCSPVEKELTISSHELKIEPIEDEEAKLLEDKDEKEDAGNQKRSVADIAIYEEKGLDLSSIKDQAKKGLDDDKEKISLVIKNNLDSREKELPVMKMSEDDKLVNTISLASKTEEDSESNCLHGKTNIKDLQILEDSVTHASEENIVQIDQKESIDHVSSAGNVEFIEQNSGTVFEEKEKLPEKVSEVVSRAGVTCAEEREIDKSRELKLMATSSSVALDEISNFNPYPESRTEILQEDEEVETGIQQDGLGILAHVIDSPREIILKDAPLCIASADGAYDNQVVQELEAASQTTLKEKVMTDYEVSSTVEDHSTKDRELAIDEEVLRGEKVVPIDDKGAIMQIEKGEQEEAGNSKRTDYHALTLGEERDTDITGSVSQHTEENLNPKVEGEAKKFGEKAETTPSTVMEKETSVEEICYTEMSAAPQDKVPEINKTDDLELGSTEKETIPERYQHDEEKQEDSKVQIEAIKIANENEKVSENVEEPYVDENVSTHIVFENEADEEANKNLPTKESLDGILQVKEEEKIVEGIITLVNNQEKVREPVDVYTGTETEVPNDEEQEMLSTGGEMKVGEANTSRRTEDKTEKTYDEVEKPDFSSHGKNISEISHGDGVLFVAKDNENCIDARTIEEIFKSETSEATSPNESGEAVTSTVIKDIQPVEWDTEAITVDSEIQESKAGIAPSDVTKEIILQCREEANAYDDYKENAETSKSMECAISSSKIMQVETVVAVEDQEPRDQLVKLQHLPLPPHTQDSEMEKTEENDPTDLQRASNITGNVKQNAAESLRAEGESTRLQQEEATCGQDGRTTDEIIDLANKSSSTEIAKPSLSDILGGSSKESLEMADHQTSQKEELKAEKTEEANNEEETAEEEKDRQEESNKQKTSDLGCEAPIEVDAGDADAKVAHKKSHNILSGVGTKVKHSISKVKKAIIGKSSHPKPSFPKESEKC